MNKTILKMKLKPKKSMIMLMIAAVITFALLFVALDVTAVDVIIGTDVSVAVYPESSGLKAVIKLTITGDAAADYLSEIHFTFSGAGWDSNDIKDLNANAATSGVSVYYAGANGVWDEGAVDDQGLTAGAVGNDNWAGGGAASLTGYSDNGNTNMGTGTKIFFVVIQTDATLDNGDAISFTVDSVTINGVVDAVGSNHG